MVLILKKILLVALSATLTFGCQTSNTSPGENDPKARWWSLEFFGPNYMTGWVEASLVEDVNGRTFDHGSGGVIGNGNPGDATETARGWVGGVGGNSRAVAGADLPKRIYVRWQSAVEPQTYRAWIDIGEEARQIMYDSTHRRCEETPERTARYMAALYLGLAPGGVVQAWAIDSCGSPVKIARGQAEIEPLGPHLGKSGGNYYPQPKASKRYVEKFGVPYGSW
ncbi:DUF2931 family protein [Stutzerimonas zhaodongensis]|uniref:DUF2931 family protein n=1 Tax=Stutzerimonas TaxID=2901164 RepID=UPI00313A88E2